MALDLASPQETRSLYLTLLTFLFAYAYNARTTQHDPTPESAWTIAALTPAFSALDPPPYHPHPQGVGGTGNGGDLDLDFDDDAAALELELAETLVPSYRRALAFPLYRSWALADACRADAAWFLLRGTRTVLRCLLELRDILDTHEVYYVYSRIWLDDFCRWIQACARYVMRATQLYLIDPHPDSSKFLLFLREDALIRLGEVVNHLSISKDSIGWDLVALEHTVTTAKEGQPDSDDEDVESERPALL